MTRNNVIKTGVNIPQEQCIVEKERKKQNKNAPLEYSFNIKTV